MTTDREAADRRADELAAAMAPWGERSMRTPVLGVALIGFSHHGEATTAAAGHITVAGDVRLDERRSLEQRLRLPPECSDVELAARALGRWGTAAADLLVGELALVAYDAHEDRVLLLRDHMGIRPLAYAVRPDAIWVASDPGAISRQPSVPDDLDVDAVIAPHVLNHHVGIRRTPWRAVAKVTPGTTLQIARADQRTEEHVHWRPGPRPRLDLRPRAAADALRTAVEAACAAAVRDAPLGTVGTHLSGGLDSGLVAACAQKALRSRGDALVRGYSWSAPPVTLTSSDERSRAQAMATAVGVPITWLTLGDQALQRHVTREVELEPTSMSLLETEVVARAAGDHVWTLLSGWGGDEAASFNGRDLFGELLVRRQLGRLGRELLATARHRRSIGGRSVPVEAVRVARHHVLPPLLPDRLRRHRTDRPYDDLLAAQGFEWSSLHERASGLRAEAVARERMMVSEQGSIEWLLGAGYVTARCEAWAALGATSGVTHRYPLLNRRVLDLCLALPPEAFYARGWSRATARRMSEPFFGPLAFASFKEEENVVSQYTNYPGALDRLLAERRGTLDAFRESIFSALGQRLRAELALVATLAEAQRREDS